MIVRDIEKIMEAWAPRQTAWDRDNIGLQVGTHSRKVTKILITLDVTEGVISEALGFGAELIVSHHPLIFPSMTSATEDRRAGRLLLELARHRIGLYVAHTNLDHAATGVSQALALRLGLRDLRILAAEQGHLKKIVVYVPVEHTEPVRAAMAASGAGHIGKYDQCAFRMEGEGSFRPLGNARPFIGTTGTIERVREHRLEMIVPSWQVPDVLSAMRRTHPYEEVAYDVYPLENLHSGIGAGMVGELRQSLPFRGFVSHVRRRLKSGCVRATRGSKQRISTVAVCGGSGSEYLEAAVRSGADAYVTADVKYHTFQEAEGAIALLDAGHFETEMPVLQHIAARLRRAGASIASAPSIRISRRVHNPVTYHCS
jgi:dinuclear metal center YbgI/SA1388 family protein